MKHIALIICFLLSLQGLAQKEILTIKGIEVEAYEGPNLARISKNFYADKTEITNAFYKEYLYWIKSIYGIKSHEYINAMPNASVWSFQKNTDISFERYFSSGEFGDFPVVGINLRQAKEYARWRTDRVTEMILIERGYILPSSEYWKNNRFSIAKYRNGEYQLEKELDPSFAFPNYTIPSAEEWEEFAESNKGTALEIDSQSDNSAEIKELKYISYVESGFEGLPFLYYKAGEKNKFGLYHTEGNVSELVDQNGIAKGGNWKFSKGKMNVHTNSKQNIPNFYTGFRCVARLELL